MSYPRYPHCLPLPGASWARVHGHTAQVGVLGVLGEEANGWRRCPSSSAAAPLKRGGAVGGRPTYTTIRLLHCGTVSPAPFSNHSAVGVVVDVGRTSSLPARQRVPATAFLSTQPCGACLPHLMVGQPPNRPIFQPPDHPTNCRLQVRGGGLRRGHACRGCRHGCGDGGDPGAHLRAGAQRRAEGPVPPLAAAAHVAQVGAGGRMCVYVCM